MIRRSDITKAQAAYLVRVSRGGSTSGNSRMRCRLVALGYLRLTPPNEHGASDFELTPLGRLKARAFA